MTSSFPRLAGESLGEPLAAGREADVYALDDDRVLRRYRYDRDVATEAAIMGYAAGHGFPVPAVHAARGTDMILERLSGPTMSRAMIDGELSLADGAGMTADLLRRLHALPARAGDGTVVHLDLHMDNVLLTDRGPVLVDWGNSGDGPGDLDTAMSALIMAQVAIGSINHELAAEAARFLDLFLAAAPGDPLRMLDTAVAMRERQSTLSVGEIGMLPTAAARVRGEG